ncbi:MAG: hypothetical protein RQ826_14590 [Xanthomonadales bacterium]|nr:hypothetical protein [Xanthomonadales bacterium]
MHDEAAHTAAYRQVDADFVHWAAGCGVIACKSRNAGGRSRTA